MNLYADYDKVIIAFSGGKDSLATVLDCLKAGVPKNKLELWHHCIDGEPGSDCFMDWECTEDYCRKVAEHLGIRLRMSWKVGGFLGEMLRENSRTKPTAWESDGRILSAGGVRGKKSTRRLFPQVTASLMTRWCSSYTKIDVARMVFSNEPSLKTGMYVFLTGERREESANRAKYAETAPYKKSKKRTVIQHRRVIDWSEQDVWDIIKEYSIIPHPAYYLGWGRLSCRCCIFGNADQWASARELAPAQFERIAEYETEFGKTIHRTKSVRELADAGRSTIPTTSVDELLTQANSREYTLPVYTEKKWTLPLGAFKECGGPV